MINLKKSIEKKDNFFEKLLLVRRNTKVTKGGRVFGFSVLTVVGDKNGKVGIGKGKAKEVPFAIQKAMDRARKNLITLNINNNTIYYKFTFKYRSTKIIMLPGYDGCGIISAASVRSIFEAVGIKNIFVKCFGSKNPGVLIKCVFNGLIQMNKNFIGFSFRKELLQKYR
ncbi:MAG TPA: 30S ribosomal protein S5 [Candidatus Azoamicus sp. OHIO2]